MQQSILNKIQGGLAGMYISQQVSLVMVDRDSPESDLKTMLYWPEPAWKA
jgi:hypothetical protein